MRSKFDEQLEVLHKALIEMGALCEDAIARTTSALSAADTEMAAKIPELTERIESKERDIESMCLKLLLQQQPVATDLRTVSSALKMVTDMERIGVNSGDIAEIICVGNVEAQDNTEHIQGMAKATGKMVTGSIDAFVKKDADIANAVIAYDDVVDELFDEVKNDLTSQFGNPDYNGEKVIDLLMIAKYFERMADHATEIAKWVLFSITGIKE